MKNNILLQFATLGPIGYLPASGTFATLATLPVVYFFSLYPNIYLPVVFICISVANWLIKEYIPQLTAFDRDEREESNYDQSPFAMPCPAKPRRSGKLLAKPGSETLVESKGKSNDPSEIVIDEFVGTLITFLFIPINIKTIILGFLLFRFFDILKPYPIKKIEEIGGSAGIILDDVVAGIYANLMLRFLIYAAFI